jgi:hypothetical protein
MAQAWATVARHRILSVAAEPCRCSSTSIALLVNKFQDLHDRSHTIWQDVRPCVGRCEAHAAEGCRR